MRCSADDASPQLRRLYDVTANRCAHAAVLRLKRCGCKILEKVKFSQTEDF